MTLHKALLLSSITPLLATACEVVSIKPNLEHCTYNEGDRYCVDLDPSRPYCTQGDDECNLGGFSGCVADVTPQCHAPCGVLPDDECGSASSSGSDTGTGSGSSGSSDSGSDSTTTDSPPCTENEDCVDADTPFCDMKSGECVRCDGLDDGDAGCAELDASTPLCVEGACVVCTPENPAVCDDQLLLCDGETNECAPCTEHEQCEAGACDFFDGRCFDPDNVLHVGSMQPYATVNEALDEVGAMMLDPVVLVLHEGADFNETATVDAGAVALVAAENEQPQWVYTGMPAETTLTVTGMDTRVYLHRVRLTGNLNDIGLAIDDGAYVDARRSRIVQNSGGGILAQNGAELTLRNCFVGGGTEAIGVEIDASSASILYSTVAANTFMTTPALGCSSPLMVDIRNSIVVSQGGTPPDELSCAGASVASSATEDDVGSFDIGWFTNYNAGDFALTTMGMPSGAETFTGVAQWQTDDPATDIDGDPRPTVDGTADYAGADIPIR